MLAMLEIAQQEIIPACLKYSNALTGGVAAKKSIGLDIPFEAELLKSTTELTELLIKNTNTLKVVSANIPTNAYESALYYRDTIIPAMNDLRYAADMLEMIVGKEYWPFPTYTDLLYKI
jgi:glutamine synthetase